MVLRDHRPAIRQQTRLTLAGIDHGLDGEGHARFELHAAVRFTVMQNLRVLVIHPPDAMAAVLAYHRKILAFGIGLNRMTDVAEPRAGPYLLDAKPHRTEADLRQALGLHIGLAHVVHAAGVAMKTIT